MCPITKFIYCKYILRTDTRPAKVQFITERLQLSLYFCIGHIRLTTEASCNIQQTEFPFCSRKRTIDSIVFAARMRHHLCSKCNKPIYGYRLMLLNPFATIIISIFQIKVHHLLRYRSFRRCNTFFKKQLCFHFRDGRSLYRGRVRYERI